MYVSPSRSCVHHKEQRANTPMAKGRTTAADGSGGGAATGPGQETKVQEEQQQLVIQAPLHCDGCARKLRRSLQRLQGVGEVTVDSRTNTVVLRGSTVVESATEVVQVVERKTGEKAVLLSPTPEKLPAKAEEGNQKKGNANKDVANQLLEVDMKMVTVLKMNLHCDACSEEIKKRILKITGVEEAMPHLKSSHVMVKGKVEPATLVGFIHKCTGRRPAIIRAEPLDLLEAPNSPVPPIDVLAPPVEADENKKDEPPENPPAGKKKKDEPNEENRGGGGGGGGGGGEDNVDDDNPKTEKPASEGHGATEEHGTQDGEAPDHNNAGDGQVLEKHAKDDRLFTVPMPPGIVTVAPQMALSNRSYCYPAYPSYAQCYYPYQLYQQQPYPAYACSPAAMYGYGYPANYPPEAFSEENPSACTIV